MTDFIIYHLKLYSIIFPLVLLYFYLIPAGLFYWFFFIRTSRKLDVQRIQKRLPGAGSIRREIRASIGSMALFSVLGLFMYEAWRLGYTRIYLDVRQYSIAYLIFSVTLLAVLHDTYFYWAHRFMHWKPAYRYFHRLHHRSVTPTPWAVYAFQPLETIVQFGIYPIVLLLIPLHPLVLAVYLTYNILVNTGGHTGHEFLPEWMNRHWFFKWNNNVTHHDLHHTTFNYNFGLYFNLWDRWMGTFCDLPEKTKPV